MHFIRRHRHVAVFIRAPQQQQIAQALQTGGRTCLNHGIGALCIHLDGRDHRDRITFRETPAQARGHQHIADANIGVARQVLQLQIFGAAVACRDDANIVAQHLNRQRMRRVANQQHAAGHLADGDNLTDDAFVADDRLAFIDAIDAAFVDHHLIGVRIGAGGDHLRHHLVLVLTQRRTEQFAQACVFLLILPQHQQVAVFQEKLAAQGFILQFKLLARRQRTGNAVKNLTRAVGQEIKRTDRCVQIVADLGKRTQAAIGDDNRDGYYHRQKQAQLQGRPPAKNRLHIFCVFLDNR